MVACYEVDNVTGDALLVLGLCDAYCGNVTVDETFGIPFSPYRWKLFDPWTIYPRYGQNSPVTVLSELAVSIYGIPTSVISP